MRLRFALLALPLMAFSCEVRDLVNAAFPPVSMEDQRQAAIEGAVASLAALGQPNVAAGIDLAAIREQVGGDVLAKLGVDDLTVSSDGQLLLAAAKFNVSLPFKLPASTSSESPTTETASAPAAGAAPGVAASEADDLLARLTPAIEGQLSISLGPVGSIRVMISFCSCTRRSSASAPSV